MPMDGWNVSMSTIDAEVEGVRSDGNDGKDGIEVNAGSFG